MRRTGNQIGAQIKRFLLLALLFVFVAYSVLFIDKIMKPNIASVAEVKVKSMITQIAIDSISECFSNDNVDYEELLVVKTDTNGKITMVESNTVLMNRLSTKISDTIQKKYQSLEPSKLKLSVGTIMGSQLLSQTGPYFNLKVLPIAVTKIKFITEFSEAGINQTMYKVFIETDTTARVMVPFMINNIDVKTQVPIVETLVVGDVPQSYIVVPKDEVWNVVGD